MPSDIRSFFGGKGGQSSNAAPETPKKTDVRNSRKTTGRGKRKVVSDDEDEQPLSRDLAPYRTRPEKTSTVPASEEVTTSDYFSSKSKQSHATPKRSNSKSSHPAIKAEFSPAKTNRTAATPKSKLRNAASINETPASASDRSLRQSSRKTAKKGYSETQEEGQRKPNKHNGDDSDEDIFGAEYKRGSKALDDYNTESSGTDVEAPSQKNATSRKRKSSMLSDPEDENMAANKKTKGKRSTSSTKTSAKKARKSTRTEAAPENPELQKILNDIPIIRPPTPPTQGTSAKFEYTRNAARSQTAPNAGSKEIPEGADDCLAGLTFVFTGLLDALGREEGQDLVKRYGGKVTTGPSSRTDYVVLGTDAGPKKLETIRKFGLKTINEDGLFALIKTLPVHGGSGQAALKAQEKRLAEERKVQEAAREQEKDLAVEMEKKMATLPETDTKQTSRSLSRPDDQLWTVKYAPAQLNQICGNKTQVEKLQTWLRNWQKNAKVGFKKGGSDGSGLYRAVMIHGNPGIGKTTAAHLVARLEGYDVVESNASDTRSKKLIETGLKGVLDTTSLLGYFSANGQEAKSTKRRLVLIMDEVDGMSAGDRGGVGAMASICKKTSIPIILICNDRKQPKMKPFDHVTFDLPFRKPTTDQVRSRIMTILFREGINKIVPANVVNALIEGSGADIRRIINMISAAKLDQQAMDYNQVKKMTNAWEKNVILKPWDITQKILGGGLFTSNSKSTLNEKAELYFNDHEFSFLMLQENYLHTNPILAGSAEGRKKGLKILDLVDKAAESISDGDLIDAMIHGPQQHWSLMPVHAIFSFVRPASYVAGSTAGNRIQFTSWLGNNSKQGKLVRYVKDIQGHMRLRASGDRHEIRQQYLPLLWLRLVKTLELHGNDPQCIENVMDLMDSYFITRDDWDAIVELGVGPQDADKVKLSSQIKSNFTRKYNATSHPLPFLKAGTGAPQTKAAKVKPDLEEAIDESDEEVLIDPAAEETQDEELDLKKDKYVQAPKKRKAVPKKTGKATSAAEAEETNENESAPAKRSRARGKGAGKSSKSKAK